MRAEGQLHDYLTYSSAMVGMCYVYLHVGMRVYTHNNQTFVGSVQLIVCICWTESEYSWMGVIRYRMVTLMSDNCYVSSGDLFNMFLWTLHAHTHSASYAWVSDYV